MKPNLLFTRERERERERERDRAQLTHKHFSFLTNNVIAGSTRNLVISLLTLTIAFTSACGVDLDEDDGVKIVAAGQNHTVALKNDGTLWAWGRNYNGQLGDGTGGVLPLTEANNKSIPVQIGADYWIAVAAGDYHTVAIKNNGTLWAWGKNNSGQLGDNTIGSTTNDKNSPVQESSKDTNWIAVSACGDYTAAIKNNGTLWAWGNNGYGQLGDNSTSSSSNPKQVVTDKKWSALSVGFGHIVAIDTDGNLWAWGWNGQGQLGCETSGDKSTPVKVVNSDPGKTQFGNVKTVFAGTHHTVAIKNDGTLWAWGSNQYGQLGDDGTNSSNPKRIGMDKDWVSVSGGEYHTIALKNDGTLWAWGRNDKGQLGLGDDKLGINQPSPQRLGKAADLVRVSGGSSHSTALRRSGILWVWGSNEYGQLGNDTIPTGSATDCSPKPIAVKWE